jgi:tRNA(Ile)-lysidine synthase
MSKSGSAADKKPVADSELPALFADFPNVRKLLLAVSGGPDSTALLLLAARWRAKLEFGPELFAATIDHGLRATSKAEAKAAAKFAAKLNIPHATLRWTGKKPITGVQEAARDARYALFVEHATQIGADALATAHTRDDQAETVLHRIARGSGIGGLAGIRRKRTRGKNLLLVRPLLDLPKSRLVATLKKARIPFANDPTNRDDKYLRARLRKLAPVLAKRMSRAEEALRSAAEAAAETLLLRRGGNEFDAAGFFVLPEEISLRVLRDEIDHRGTEGPAELAKVENLYTALMESHRAGEGLKRTLAGALITLAGGRLTVAPAPARKAKSAKHLGV